MKFRKSVVLGAAVVAALFATPASADTGSSEVIIKVAPGTVAAAGTGGQVVQKITDNTFVLKVPNANTQAVIASLDNRATTQWVEPNVEYHAALSANDPCLTSTCAGSQGPQWNLAKVNAPSAWDVSTGSSNIKVAELDSGVDVGHPDLAGRVTTGPNFSTEATDSDLFGHGTHVAGILAANTNNGVGVAGITWQTSVTAVKVLDHTGSGSASALARALYWSADNGMRVANLSLGGEFSSAVAEAVQYAQARGVLVVAAAANSSTSMQSYPAALPDVVAVGNSTQTDTRSASSNFGTWVDVFAPGEGIVSTWPRNLDAANPYNTLTGTSMATPLVSGLAALIWSKRPNLTAAGVASIIKSTTDAMDGSGTYVETGRINAGRAMANLGDGYRFAASDGGVFNFGQSFQGSIGNLKLAKPIVAMASDGTEAGYWLFASDGGVFSFGGTQFYGSTGDKKLNQPIVAAMATASGRGYWLVASDGGVFSFGDAVFNGSTGNIKLNKPIVAAVRTATGNGYWLIASDGGVFSFGDATFYGSTGNLRLNRPIVGAARDATGNGYWLTGSDGGVFAFGDAQYKGSTGAISLKAPVVAMRSSAHGDGYYLAAADGGVFAFGDAPFLGSAGATQLNRPIVAVS